jgi:hypothetical protein
LDESGLELGGDESGLESDEGDSVFDGGGVFDSGLALPPPELDGLLPAELVFL